MIAITFALPTESSGLVRQLRDKSSENRNGVPLIRGSIHGREIELLHTGVGEKSCQGRLGSFLADARHEFLISCGFAGAAAENLHVGDLVLGENFSDLELFAAMRQILHDRGVRIGNLFSSSAMIDSPTARREIAQKQGAIAIDMETHTIAEVCRIRDVPMASLRVISDTSRQPFPAPANILFDIERQRTDFSRLLPYLFKNPATAWRLIRFAQQISAARRALTFATIDIVREIEFS
jgi:adenosylhomocysteine nucleosidase